MAQGLPHASTIEGIRFTAEVLLPNMVQGLFRRRANAVSVATRLGLDGRAVRLIGALRERHGPGPLWIRAPKDEALLILSREDVRRVLEEAPAPFAADAEAKRRGMSHFQPHALTISRGARWEDRRRFTEAVLDTGRPIHRLADRFQAVAEEEAVALLQGSEAAGTRLDWDAFAGMVRRVTRRVVLGDAARNDDDLSDALAALMDEANRLPKRSSERFEPFMRRVGEYVRAAEAGSLVSLFDAAPSGPDTRVEGQVPHWLFALGDTLAINAFRALALIATHSKQRGRVEQELASAEREHGLGTVAGVDALDYLEACLEEAMRLWPTTPLLSRETTDEVRWNGAVVPAGTQVLISNTFHHRDREIHDFADRFEPEAWTGGRAGEDWSFNHFSHGPQGCPGAGLALFVGKALLANLLRSGPIELLEPRLDPARPLPYGLDFFKLRFGLEPRTWA